MLQHWLAFLQRLIGGASKNKQTTPPEPKPSPVQETPAKSPEKDAVAKAQQVSAGTKPAEAFNLSGFRFSERSFKNLHGVHPDLVRVAKFALHISKVDFVVTEGLRTEERQRQLVAQKKSQTFNSRHLTGHAIDVAAWVDGTVSWEWQHYEEIAVAFKRAAMSLKIPIVWGGDWKSLKDGVHFELDRKHYP